MGPGRELLQFLAILKLNKVLTLVLGSSLESFMSHWKQFTDKWKG